MDNHSMATIEEIHESLVNSQRKQMVAQIDEYGLCDFWPDYREFLSDTCIGKGTEYMYFAEVTISYFRIKNR